MMTGLTTEDDCLMDEVEWAIQRGGVTVRECLSGFVVLDATKGRRRRGWKGG
jgi:hypothetical protein